MTLAMSEVIGCEGGKGAGGRARQRHPTTPRGRQLKPTLCSPSVSFRTPPLHGSPDCYQGCLLLRRPTSASSRASAARRTRLAEAGSSACAGRAGRLAAAAPGGADPQATCGSTWGSRVGWGQPEGRQDGLGKGSRACREGEEGSRSEG
jgi:hypothetical protein